ATALLSECRAISAAHGFPPDDSAVQRMRSVLTAPGSTFAASMLRDVERGAPIERDHIIGDLIRRADAQQCDCPLLRIANAHLKSYEARRARERAAA
ncbi:MAG: ketopantoate reductase C-terminal domain-containing protein, partial [Pseudomonadota bacterium]